MHLKRHLGIDIIEELNLGSLPKEKKNKLAKQAEVTLSSRLTNAFYLKLNDSEKEKLDEIIKNDGDVRSFLQKNISNPQKIVDREVNNFVEETKSIEKKIRNKINDEKYNDNRKLLDEESEMGGGSERLKRMEEQALQSRQKKIRRTIFVIGLVIIISLIYFFV